MITSTTQGLVLRNPSDWFDPHTSWTRSIYVNYGADPTGADYYSNFLLSADNPSDFYIGSFTFLDTGVSTIDLELFIGGILAATDTAPAPAANTDFYLTARYTSATHLFELLIDGIVVASFTHNISAVTDPITKDYLLNDNTGLTITTISTGYERFFQRALSNTEIISESGSITPVSTTSLLSTCPLQTSIDLTDHNGKLRIFLATGIVITDLSDPLITTITAPPTNIDPNTALEVTVDSAIFQDTLTAGVATTVWYKCTAGLGVKVMGACGFGDLVTYKPTILVFEGLVNALNNDSLFGISGQNVPVQFPVTPGLDYYFKETRNSAVSPATIQFSVLNALDLPVAIGSIAVNNDDDIPLCALLDSATGYPISFVNPFDAFGEGGDPLDSGTIIVTKDRATLKPILYNAILAPVTLINLVNYDRISSNSLDTFAIGFQGGGLVNAVIRLSDAAGVLDPTIFELLAAGLQSIGLNNDASIVYYAPSLVAGTSIKSWDLLTNTAGSDLVAGVTGYNNNKDLIVLKDGSILVPRSKLSVTKSFIVKDYNAAGAELHSYDFGTDGDSDNRIATAIDNPNSFWVWIKVQDNPFGGYSNFKNVKVSDGSILSSTGPVVQFEGSKFNGTPINTPARFGHSESCPFWITRVIIGPEVNARSGLYNLSGTGGTTRLFHDRVWIDASLGTTENLAIPNPFTESYLVGDE